MAYDINNAIDIREYKKNSRTTNHVALSFKNMTFEAQKTYYVADLPDDIIVTGIYYFASNMIKNGGTTADPTTMRAKYQSVEGGDLAELERKYYSKPGRLVLDVGNTAHSGAVVISFIHVGIILGPYS